MKQVRLIIANTQIDTVYFNYGDDCDDITRVFVEDHSPWEEVNDDDIYTLHDFVRDYNMNNKGKKSFAFLIIKEEQISPQSAIKFIVDKQNAAIEKQKKEEEARRKAAEKKKQEAKLKRLAKTEADKRKLFEQLKQELGE